MKLIKDLWFIHKNNKDWSNKRSIMWSIIYYCYLYDAKYRAIDFFHSLIPYVSLINPYEKPFKIKDLRRIREDFPHRRADESESR